MGLPVKWPLPNKFNQPGTTVGGINTVLVDLNNYADGANVTVSYGGSSYSNPQPAQNTDFIILGRATGRINQLNVYGGRRVAIIGGRFGGGGEAVLRCIGQTQWVYLDGCVLYRTTDGDGIGVAAPFWNTSIRPRIYIQNCHITGINGSQSGVHGDVIQQWGGVDSNSVNYFTSINVYNCYAESGYQGWYLPHNSSPAKGPGAVNMERVVTRAMTSSGGSSSGPKFMYYFYNASGTVAYPTSIVDCHLIEGGGKTLYSPSLGGLIVPDTGTYPLSFSPAKNSSWQSASWTNSPYHTGTFYKGEPTSWTRLQESQVGAGYTHIASLYEDEPDPPEENIITGTSGDDFLQGTSADETLLGLGGADILDGGGGNDILEGGSGADTFVIRAGNGSDTITDFNVALSDVIKLVNYDIFSFTQLQPMLQQIGSDTIINLPNGEKLTLNNVVASQLAATEFIFENENEPPPPEYPEVEPGEAVVCNSFKTELFQGIHDLDSDVIKIALYTSLSGLKASTTTYTTSNEVSGPGYTAGGAALSSVTITADGAVMVVDADDVVWSGASLSGVVGAMIYNASKSNRAIMVMGFPDALKCTGGTFTVAMPAPDASNAVLRG